MREVDIAVVGGGPGGLAAATEAAVAGAQVAVIEERPTLGGQYYRQMPQEFASLDGSIGGNGYADGGKAIRRLQDYKVEILVGAQVWGIFGHTLAVYHDGRNEMLSAKRLILAPGAQEVPVAFPGWTLPGVMMGGAAQSLLVSQRIVPTGKVIMAGAGPLQLRVAAELQEAGTQVVAILEASANPPVSMEHALKSLGHWDKVKEGLEYWVKLKRAGIPYLNRHVPVRALGSRELEAVVIAQVDTEWNVVPGTERTVEADTLCLSFGFLPSNQLCGVAGCRLTYDPEVGVWFAWHDDDQQTSVPGVYVAGEAGGIGGADVALQEGRIAAFAALRSLGLPGAAALEKADEKARKRLNRAKGFAAVTRNMMTLKPALFDLITDETILCRCEEVTAGDVKKAMAAGETSLRGIKIRTRAGMGTCQGRMCGHLVSRLIAAHSGIDLSLVLPDTPRPPVRPVPLGVLAATSAG